MAEVACVSHGPDGFEELLGDAKLSEREADAVRTVVLGLTAAQAAPLIGVGASTVGSYRQRAYQKLGVSTKAEFLGLSCARNGEVPLRKRRPSKWRCRRLLGSSLLSPRAGWSRLPTERFQTSWACAQMRQRPLLRARATCPSSSRLPRRRTPARFFASWRSAT